MNKKIKYALYGALMAVLSASSMLPASAAPIFPPNVSKAKSDVMLIRSPHHGRFQRRGNRVYYNNYRGYPYSRTGYRYYNGYWFPPAAFLAGAIIGGALNNGAVYQSQQHVAWCQNRYRSYRVYDDTFQPYHGPRRRCYSPYN